MLLATASQAAEALRIPPSKVSRALALLDNTVGLILLYTLSVLPIVVWIMRDQFDTIPTELDEAGFVDGLSSWGVFLRIIVPIALPGIVTGIALRSALNLMDLGFSFWTIVIGHATFCIVTVYNNVSARLRRTGASQIEASMDLGANIFQTFRYILLPAIATALPFSATPALRSSPACSPSPAQHCSTSSPKSCCPRPTRHPTRHD